MRNDIFMGKRPGPEWLQAKDRQPDRAEPKEPARRSDDGWVELAGNRLVVHDPVGDGRYASILPEGSVRLWVGSEEISGVTVVASCDSLRWEVNAAPDAFAVLTLAPDRMSLTMQLVADPFRIPDSLSLSGHHPTVIRPGFSPQAKERAVPPQEWLQSRLAELGVTTGIDEAAIAAELASPAGQPVVIARGQEPRAYRPGLWHWRLPEGQEAELGQVLAVCEGGQEARVRITVTGEVSGNPGHEEEPPAYRPGQGTRLIQGSRIVATAVGRVHRRPEGSGCRVDLMPELVLEGPVEGDLVLEEDLLVRGDVRGARIRCGGEIRIEGDVADSELRAESITISGQVERSRLLTLTPGHYRPLAAELAFMHSRIVGLSRRLQTQWSLPELALCELGLFARRFEQRARELEVVHPLLFSLTAELIRSFSPLAGGSSFDTAAAERLLTMLAEMRNAPAPWCSTGDIRVGAMEEGTVWAERDVLLAGNARSSRIYAGGAVSSALEATLTDTLVVAGRDARLGTLSAQTESGPVTVHSRRLAAERIGPGTVFEFGAFRQEFTAHEGPTLALADAAGRLRLRGLSAGGAITSV